MRSYEGPRHCRSFDVGDNPPSRLLLVVDQGGEQGFPVLHDILYFGKHSLTEPLRLRLLQQETHDLTNIVELHFHGVLVVSEFGVYLLQVQL